MIPSITLKHILSTHGFQASVITHQGTTEFHSSGYEIHTADNGYRQITYTLGSWANLVHPVTPDEQRRIMEQEITEMERVLSLEGVPVILFVPDEGTFGFHITVLDK